MADDTPPLISRRILFGKGASLLAGALLALGTATAAVAKMTQKAAAYQDKPQADQRCSNCSLFKAPDSCTLVDGTINPDGWCRFYAKKTV